MNDRDAPFRSTGCEPLEPRRMLSSPTTIAGMVISFVITDGADPFDASGGFTVTTAGHEANYQLVGSGGVEDSFGTFTYTRTGADAGSISFHDSSVGFGFSSNYTFANDLSGSYRFDGGGGSRKVPSRSPATPSRSGSSPTTP